MGRRLLTDAIVNADEFITMPASAQGLYLQLMFAADDDGFVKNPRTIARMSNASDDDLQILLTRRYLLQFEHGVVLIKHWRMHNIRKLDRYTPTVYVDEYNSLFVKTNGAYTQNAEEGVSCKGLTVWVPTSLDTGTTIEQSRNQHRAMAEPQSNNDGTDIANNGTSINDTGTAIDPKILIERKTLYKVSNYKRNKSLQQFDRLLDVEDNPNVNGLLKTQACAREEFLGFLKTNCNLDKCREHIESCLPERKALFDEYVKVLISPKTKRNEKDLLTLTEDKFVRIFNGLWNLDEIDNMPKYVWASIQKFSEEETTNETG